MNISKGIYWDDSCNPIVNNGCHCECGDNCWAHRKMNWLKSLNPNPDENGVGWYPHRMDKIDITGKSKTWAMNWLGDMGYSNVDTRYVKYVFNLCYQRNKTRREKCGGLPPHTFLFLTKWPRSLSHIQFPKDNNIWIGTSITGHSVLADTNRIESLRWIKGIKRWISIEPLISPLPPHNIQGFDQVIVGAETGHNARPCNPDWIRLIRGQCAEADVPFFLKQIDAKRNRILDGRTHDDLAWVSPTVEGASK